MMKTKKSLKNLVTKGLAMAAFGMMMGGEMANAQEFLTPETNVLESISGRTVRVKNPSYANGDKSSLGFDIDCDYTGNWYRQYSISTGINPHFSLGVRGNGSNMSYGYLGKDGDNAWMYFAPNGNIGIGVSQPSSDLDINGELSVRANDHEYILRTKNKSVSDAEQFTMLHHDGNTWLNNARGVIALNPTSGRNVGIGTSTPESKLHVEGSGNQTIRVKTTTDNSVGFHAANTNGWLTLGKQGNLLKLNNSGTFGDNHIVINEAGNVGIGTSAPTEKLHLVNTRAAAVLESNGANNWAFLRLKGNQTPAFDIAMNNNGAGDLEFRPNGSNANKMILTQQGNLSVDGDLAVAGAFKANALRQGTSDADGMVQIKHPTSGEMIINASTGADIKFTNANDWASKMVIRANGEVEIAGNTYPTTTGTDGQVLGTDGAGNLTWIDKNGGQQGKVEIASTSDNEIQFNGTQNANIAGDGDLFLTAGSGKGLHLGNKTNNNHVYVAGNGRVGIGTTSPDKKFHLKETVADNGTAFMIDAEANLKPNLMFGVEGSPVGNIRVNDQDGNKMQFQTGSNLEVALSIEESGKVVIPGPLDADGGVTMNNTSATELLFKGTGKANLTSEGHMYLMAAEEVKLAAGNRENDLVIQNDGKVVIAGQLEVAGATLPTTAGTAGQILSTNDAGDMEWIDQASHEDLWTKNGNDIYRYSRVSVGTNETAANMNVAGGEDDPVMRLESFNPDWGTIGTVDEAVETTNENQTNAMAQVNEAEQTWETAQVTLANANEEVQKVQAQLELIQDEKVATESAKMQLSDEVYSYTSQISTLQDEIAQLDVALAEYNAQKDELQAHFDSFLPGGDGGGALSDEEVQTMSDQYNGDGTAQGTMDAITQAIDILDTEKATREKEMSDAQMAKTDAQVLLNEKTAELERLIDEIQQTSTALDGALAAKDQAVTEEKAAKEAYNEAVAMEELAAAEYAEKVKLNQFREVAQGTALWDFDLHHLDGLTLKNGVNNQKAFTVSPLAEMTIYNKATFEAKEGVEIDFAGDYDAELTAEHNMSLLPNGSLFLGAGGNKYQVSLDQSGKVGIGTSSPSHKLDVAGSIGLADELKFENSGKVQAANSILMQEGGSTGAYMHLNNGNVAIVPAGSDGVTTFYSWDGASAWSPKMKIKSNGQVEIGNYNEKGNLVVNGNVKCNSLRVTQNVWADYVFADDYKLMDLDAVDAFVKENKHLPNVPAASEIEGQDMDISKMNEMFMRKIEELTLYMIQLENENDQLQERLEAIEETSSK